MKITMYEVNFGESVLYEENSQKLLVDCGAMFDGTGKLAFDRVRNDLDKNTKLMITHFDRDHYNGICEIPEDKYRFEEIKLPLYYYDRQRHDIIDTMDCFIDALKSWISLMLLDNPQKSKLYALHNFLVKLPNLVESSDKISCVEKGDCVSVGGKQFKILWPQRNTAIKRTLYADEMLGILRDSTSDYDTLERFIQLADKYVAVFGRIYRYYCRNNQKLDPPKEREDEITSEDGLFTAIRLLNVLYWRLANIRFDRYLDPRNRDRVVEIDKKLTQNMNACSIVFACDEDVIAFGDATPDVIKYLKDEEKNDTEQPLSRSYRVLKVPHHGTAAYWTDLLPKAQHYLVSNSGHKRMKWTIDARYGENYKGQMVCTNTNSDRCEYWKKEKKACSVNAACHGKIQISI